METFYLVLVVFLFILAVFDLVVGVSNDAVNFLNSAIGSKAASFKVIMLVAGVGIFVGATFSNGMMDVARHGIYQPDNFYFSEIMCILLAVMLTDVVLLDIFNSLGMPTSTTVSMVFELLGGTFALALVKIAATDGALGFGDLLNTDKALSVILAIFLSVAVAFVFGTLVQYFARILFTFNYKKKYKYSIAIFGGLATTAIIYFMLIKGMEESSFMTLQNQLWVVENTQSIVLICLLCSTVLMQVLHWLKVNVFKVVVLLGTFALALAFAGNDLVNFIGVPLAGYSSYIDYVAQPAGSVTPDTFLMTSLLSSAKTPWYFLVGSGAVMVIALFTSRKAQNVVKTSLDLSRQEEGEENFGTSPMARTLVRATSTAATAIDSFVPARMKRWVDSRFNKDEMILEDGAAFDLVRAAVNLVLGGLLIAMGTSLKLPLSTTYVAFMVAMGSSLADRAWGRESAVYRITGVLSVIGGWFITAGAAFAICFFVTLIIYYGGVLAIVAMIALAVFILFRSHFAYKKKQQKEKGDPVVKKLMATRDSDQAFALLREHTRNELESVLDFTEQNFKKVSESFLTENLRGLRKAKNAIDDEKMHLKQMKRIGALGMRRIDDNVAIDKGLYFYQGNDFVGEIVYSLGRMCEPCLEHIDNNFNPLEEAQKKAFSEMAEHILAYVKSVENMIQGNVYDDFEKTVFEGDALTSNLALLKRGELKRIQGQTTSIKVSMVYLNMIQEAQNVVSFTTNLLKVSRKFQLDH